MLPSCLPLRKLSSYMYTFLFLLPPPTVQDRSDMLRDLFAKYGELGDVYIPRDYQTRQPRGFAFVRFANRSDGEEAQKALDGTTLDGRVLAILEAQKGRSDNPKQAMTERGGGGPARDQRRWGNERDHRPRGGDGYGYGDRGRGYNDYDRSHRGGASMDYGYDYGHHRGYGDRAGYRDGYNYSSSGSNRDTGYGYAPAADYGNGGGGYDRRGYDDRGRDYDYDPRRAGAAAAGYGGDRRYGMTDRYHERSPHREHDRDMPPMRYREGAGAAYDRSRNDSGSPVAASRPLRSRSRSRSRDRAL